MMQLKCIHLSTTLARDHHESKIPNEKFETWDQVWHMYMHKQQTKSDFFFPKRHGKCSSFSPKEGNYSKAQLSHSAQLPRRSHLWECRKKEEISIQIYKMNFHSTVLISFFSHLRRVIWLACMVFPRQLRLRRRRHRRGVGELHHAAAEAAGGDAWPRRGCRRLQEHLAQLRLAAAGLRRCLQDLIAGAAAMSIEIISSSWCLVRHRGLII